MPNKDDKQRGIKKRLRSSSKQDTNEDTDSDMEIEQPNSLTCKTCLTVFTKQDDKLIQCDRCNKWVCLECTGVDENTYAVLNTPKGKRLHWFCKECEEDAMKAVHIDMEIKERCDEYLGILRDEIKEVKQELTNKVSMEVGAVRVDMDALRQETEKTTTSLSKEISDLKKTFESSSQSPGSSAEQLNEAAAANMKEISERDSRKNNIIIFNLKESEKDDPKNRIDEDLEQARALLHAIQVKVPIQNPVRLGKKPGDKPRPLRLSTSSPENVKEILKGAAKLQEVDQYKGIFINKDLTPLEREAIKKLVVKKRALNDKAKEEKSGETWVIRGDQVVKKKQKKDDT